MDILKRNWQFVVVIAVTLIISSVLFVLILSSSKKVSTAEAELGKVKTEKEAINKYPYQMTKTNKINAESVANDAWNRYNEAFDALYETRGGADSAATEGQKGKYLKASEDEMIAKNDMTPARAKTFITRQCDAMRRTLEQQNIQCSDVKSFTFEDIVNTDRLPDPDHISDMMRNVLIVEEIVRLVSDSGVTAVSKLERSEDKLVDQGKDYKYLPFEMTVTGTYPTVRKFINDLNEAEYLLIVRELNVTGSDTIEALDTPPQAGVSKKRDRIVFKEMSAVSAQIKFDYVELIRAK